MALTKANYYQKPQVQFTTSWDDGKIEELEVMKVLEEFNITATFFIVVDWVGTDGHLTWKHIREIDEHPLFRVGSHTISHPQDLKLLYEEDLFYEIQNSKDMIETVLGHKIVDFCYPRGRHNDTVRHQVARAGYLRARTTLVGHLETGPDPYQTPTTVHVYAGRPEYKLADWVKYAKEKFEELLENPEGKVFHLWGHGYEVIRDDELGHLREFLRWASERAELVPQKLI